MPLLILTNLLYRSKPLIYFTGLKPFRISGILIFGKLDLWDERKSPETLSQKRAINQEAHPSKI